MRNGMLILRISLFQVGFGLISVLVLGVLWIPRVVVWGVMFTVAAFLIYGMGKNAAGGIGQQRLFIGLILLICIGSGISASGALTLIVDFTTPEQAGLLMGVWTVAHQLAEVVGNVMGGVMVDGVFAMSGSYLAAFGTVFGFEIIAALMGLVLLSRINISTFLGAGSHTTTKLYQALVASD